MALVTLNDVSMAFPGRRVLDAASLSLQEGEAVGLIGANGSGKTTILRIIAGALAAGLGRASNAGRACASASWNRNPTCAPTRACTMPRFRPSPTSWRWKRRMREIERALADADSDRRKELLRQLGGLQSRFEHAGGYERESRASAVLMGLGFNREEFTRPVSVLSGGERTRLALARLLLREADLLLLDEPTNHLDLAGIEWLETYLQKKFRGAALIVSHDRLFLDRTVRKVLDLEGGRVTEYPGNYSQYAQLKELRRLEHQRKYQEQRVFIEKEEDFIRRYHAAQRGREARGRQKRLDRLERIAAPIHTRKISVRFDPTPGAGETCIRAEAISKSFGEQALFRNLSLEIYRGERVGIIGPNGAGKTTLLKVFLGLEAPDAGTVQLGHNVRFGRLEQEPSGLTSGRTVLEEIWQRNRKQDEVEVRSLLGRFLFSDDEAVGKRLCDLSGGERTRVALACLMVDRPNALALDEPTNHLDIPSRVALEAALDGYSGTLLIVSHDRYLLNRLVRKLLVLDGAGGTPKLIHGNYETYERQRQEAALASRPPGRRSRGNRPLRRRTAARFSRSPRIGSRASKTTSPPRKRRRPASRKSWPGPRFTPTPSRRARRRSCTTRCAASWRRFTSCGRRTPPSSERASNARLIRPRRDLSGRALGGETPNLAGKPIRLDAPSCPLLLSIRRRLQRTGRKCSNCLGSTSFTWTGTSRTSSTYITPGCMR